MALMAWEVRRYLEIFCEPLNPVLIKVIFIFTADLCGFVMNTIGKLKHFLNHSILSLLSEELKQHCHNDSTSRFLTLV